jgi:hypothetical protein
LADSWIPDLTIRQSANPPIRQSADLTIRHPPMGILKHLLFWPVTAPIAGTKWSMNQVIKVVEEELTDDSVVKQDFMALQMKLELGEITDDEYVAEEAAIMARLREVRSWREKLGKSVAGGPVRVARGPGEE